MKHIHFPPPVADDTIRAIQADRKTVTRRVVKPQPPTTTHVLQDGKRFWWNFWEDGPFDHVIQPPYHPGDTLYVRETWNYGYCDTTDFEACCNETFFEELNPGTYKDSFLMPRYFYKTEDLDGLVGMKWRPSIHMPREAARIFLRVTDVQVERLQDITELQILEQEGIQVDFPEPKPSYMSFAYAETRLKPAVKKAFADLWNSTIKPADRALYGWEASPWVWVIEFERISREEAMNESKNIH